ncbi:hypothetical protein PMAYCL1PPCAC_23932, partial [Pristionchus mayeri]
DAVKPAPKHVKVLVWGGISTQGPCPLIILRGKESIVDSSRYQWIIHEAYLQWTQVEEWPPESADLNPIETVWALLKRYLTNTWKPKNMEELVEGIHFWWAHYLTKDLCVKLIERVQTKMRQVHANKGRPCPD